MDRSRVLWGKDSGRAPVDGLVPFLILFPGAGWANSWFCLDHEDGEWEDVSAQEGQWEILVKVEEVVEGSS